MALRSASLWTQANRTDEAGHKAGRSREPGDETSPRGGGESMNNFAESRRQFPKTTGLATAALVLSPKNSLARAESTPECGGLAQTDSAADYTLHIKNSPIEIAPKRIISAATYNGQFPGPLLRFQEGQQVTIDIYNDTDTPEQLHCHGQQVPVHVDGAAEEGTPFIPAHSKHPIPPPPTPSH